jgi:hypothetical protein
VSAQDSTRSLPPELLWGVSWVFRGEPFADRAAFDAAVAEAQDGGGDWRPDEVVLRAGSVRVSPDVDWLGDDQAADFAADNGVSFTAGELLFKVHNRFVAELRHADHQFFEGLTLDRHQEPGGPPLYELDLGS